MRLSSFTVRFEMQKHVEILISVPLIVLFCKLCIQQDDCFENYSSAELILPVINTAWRYVIALRDDRERVQY
jgi:hypothetical protein